WCDTVNMLQLARTFKDYPYDETLKISRSNLRLTNVLAAEIFALRDVLRQSFALQKEESLTFMKRVRRKLGRWLSDLATSVDGSKYAQPMVDPFDVHLAQAERGLLECGVWLKDDFKLAALHPAVLPAAAVVRRYVDECYHSMQQASDVQ